MKRTRARAGRARGGVATSALALVLIGALLGAAARDVSATTTRGGRTLVQYGKAEWMDDDDDSAGDSNERPAEATKLEDETSSSIPDREGNPEAQRTAERPPAAASATWQQIVDAMHSTVGGS